MKIEDSKIWDLSWIMIAKSHVELSGSCYKQQITQEMISDVKNAHRMYVNRSDNEVDENNNIAGPSQPGVRSLRAEVSSCCSFMFTFAGSKRALRPLWRGRYRGPGRRYAFQNLGTPSQRRNPS